MSKKIKYVNKNLPTITLEEFFSTKLKFYNKNKQNLSDWHVNSLVYIILTNDTFIYVSINTI